MSEEKENGNVYYIPANYTDSGKLMGGMVEPRNAVETVGLILLVGYPELMVIPMPGRIRIVVMVVTLLPLAVVAIMGIDGDSLLQYLGHIVSFGIKRRTLHMRRVGYQYGKARLKGKIRSDQAPNKKKERKKKEKRA